MALILRRPWDSQPQEAVGVDWGVPASRGLLLLLAPGVDLSNRSFGNLLTAVNGPAVSADRYGLKRNFVKASSQYINAGADNRFNLGSDITVLCWYRISTAPGSEAGFSLVAKDSNTGGRAYTLDVYKSSVVGGSGVRLYVNGGGTPGTNAVAEGRHPVAGDDRLVIATRSVSGNSTRLYVDGLLAASTTATTSTPTATTELRIGARTYSGYEDYLDGSIRLAAVWSRALSAFEIADISRNPWALFEPQRIFIPVAAAGGAPAESGGASASVSVTSAGAGSAAEQASGGASSSVAASAAGAGVGAEAASGGASASVAVTAAGSGSAASTESGGASATVAVSAAGAGTATESASGGAGSTVTVSAAGAGTAADGATGGSSASVAVTASGAGAAVEAASGGAAATVSVSAVGAGTGSDGETGGASATVTTTAAGAGTATEQASGGSIASVVVTAVGGSTAPDAVPAIRTLRIAAESRALLIAAEQRCVSVAHENRTLRIPS